MASSGLLDQAVACRDPECVDAAGNRSLAEPEQDGDHLYYACETCGFTFGFDRIAPEAQNEGTCAVGIPEDIRRAASAAMEHALDRKPLMQIGRRPNGPAG